MGQRRALIVGLGSIGRRHAQILHDQGWEIYAWRMNHNTRGTRGNGMHGVKDIFCEPNQVHASYDLIIISNPTSHHVSTIWDILEMFEGVKPTILVEKPFCLPHDFDTNQLNKIIEKAFLINADIHVGYNLRYSIPIMNLKNRVVCDRINKTHVHTAVCKTDAIKWPGWPFNRKLDHVTMELSHEIDYLIYLFGRVKYVEVISSAWEFSKIMLVAEFEHVSGYMSRVELDLFADVEERCFRWMDHNGENKVTRIGQEYIDASYIHQLRSITDLAQKFYLNRLIDSRHTMQTISRILDD